MIDEKGGYVFGDELNVEEVKPEIKIVKRREATPVKFDETELMNSVNKLPVFSGGAEAFQKFLDDLSKDLVPMLPAETKKTFYNGRVYCNKRRQGYFAKSFTGRYQ